MNRCLFSLRINNQIEERRRKKTSEGKKQSSTVCLIDSFNEEN